MFEKHGVRSLLRQPGTSLLTLLLSLLVATLLGTSMGLRALVEQTIRDCSERYLTIGVVDYLNGDDATDPVTIADYAARIAALPLPGSAREYEPTQEAMGWFPDYEADINTPWSRDEAVLVVRARQPQKEGEDPSAVVEQSLFSMRDVEKRIIALGETRLEPGMRYLIRGTWYKALPGTLATLRPDAAPLPLGEKEADAVAGSAVFYDRAEELKIRRRSFTLRASSRFSAFQPFQQGQLSVEEGRMISDEEAAGGARVLMLSERLSANLGISVGDRVRLCAAARDCCQVCESFDPARGPDLDAEFTVIGIFNDYIGWKETVLIPAGAGPDLTRNHANAVIGQYLLFNDEAAAFEEWAREHLPAGLRLTVEDQGYHEIIAPMRTIRNLTRLIALACVTAALGFLLLCAWLFVHRQRSTVVIMHRLGVGRFGILRYTLSGMLPLALPGAAGGAFLSRQLCRRIAEVLAGQLETAQTASYSYSATRLSLAEAAGMMRDEAPLQLLLWIGGLCCLALLLLSAVFALHVVPVPGRNGARHTGRSQVRTHRLRGGACSYAWLSELRGGGRTLLVLLIPLLAALALGAMSSSQRKTQAELDALAESSTVRGMVTDLYGSSYDKLAAKLSDLFDLLRLESLRSATLTSTDAHFLYLGVCSPETGLADDILLPELAYNGYTLDRLSVEYSRYPRLIYANGLDDAPAFLYAGEPVTAWLDGFEDVLQEGYLPSSYVAAVKLPEDADLAKWPAERDALLREELEKGVRLLSQTPCVVSTAFLQEHGLKLGDSFLVACLCGEERISVTMLRAVGSYVKLNGMDNIYLPLSLLMKGKTLAEMTEENAGTGVRVGSAIFRFSCADLEGLRAQLSGIGFTEIGDRGGARRPFLLEDESYLNLRTSLEQRLWYMKRIFLAAAVLLMLLAPLIGSLTALTRRRELNLMRSLGAARRTAFASVFLGQAGTCLAGTLAGAGLCRVFDWLDPAGVTEAAAFALLWLLGCTVVIAYIIRKGGAAKWRSWN